MVASTIRPRSPRSPSSPDLDPIAASMADTNPASIWARLIIAPLTFLSFLLSLSLIDNYTSSRISHFPRPRARFTGLFHRLFFKQNVYKEPYAPTHKSNGDKPTKKEKEEWYYHSHQRQLARREVTDALRIRQWVLWTMGVILLVVVVVGSWAMLKLVRIVFGTRAMNL